MRGAEGVELFYDSTKVKREGAMPTPIQGSLFGKDSVHTLDDEAHRHRKATFVKVCYDDQHVERIKPMVEAEVREAIYEWANHREPDGELLDDKTAGIEMQNTFRPHIAVARFAAFAAKALFEHPEWRERIQTETAERGTLIDGPIATAFGQEVRRYYPFVPVLPAFARTDFEFKGEKVNKGDRILIDVLNTNTDPVSWERADEFDPGRFLGKDFHEAEAIETFIPHGGSDVRTGHRCPGEKIAVSSLGMAVAAMCEPGVEILDEGLEFSWRAMPTRPESGGLVRAQRPEM